MKKIIPYILIFVTILQLFAPFSVGVNSGKIAVNKNQAEAADCVVNSVSFTPAGGLSKDTTTSLPSSIIATINTHDCVNKKVLFRVLESFNYVDSEVFQKKVIATNNTIELKLSPTELKCGSNDLCGFKYQTATENGSFAWKSPNDIPVNYFYKCTSKDTNGKLVCLNNSHWTGTISSGATDLEIEVPDVNFIIKMTGAVIYTDKTVTAAMSVTDTTDYTQLGIAGNITYSYYLNVFVKNKAGTIVDEKRVFYSKINSTINPVKLEINPSTNYTLDGSIDVVATTQITGIAGSSTTDKTYPEVAKLDAPLSFISNKEGDETVVEAGNISASAVNTVGSGSLPACAIGPVGEHEGTFMGCVAQALYYLFFKTTSFFFALAGKILDFTLMYSISDTSYRSTFVIEGWGIVRDFCNMFFIFVLLYVAFGTILNLNSVKTKEMIINVVIIGLLINFSLFVTQVIIDASNILTRVFYNQNTIVTGVAQKDTDGNPLPVTSELGAFGEIKLSEAIVNKVDPQELITRATDVEKIQIKGTAEEGGIDEGTVKTTAGSISTGSFILVVLLATAINVVGFIAFLSSALIFIGRVVMLWLAMILAPLAFFSYTVPALQGIKMIGWKNWWTDTLKMAFVAPVFVFFMYIIVGFMDKGLGIVSASLKTGSMGLNFVVAIFVPFIFVMILLMKAKSIAVDMSGEIGKTLSKAGAAVGGLALGAATGGVAMLGRGTIGALGNKMANSNWAQTHGAIGRGLQNAGKWTASKSFDARNTSIGKSAAKGLGIEGSVGKAKEGGYTKHKEEVTAKRRQKAEDLKLRDNSNEVQALHKSEEDKSKLENANKNDTDRIDGTLVAKRRDATDLSQKLTSANSKLAKAQKEAEMMEKDGKATQEDKDAAKVKIAAAQTEADAAQSAYDKNAKEIAELAKERVDLNGAKGKYADKTADGKVNKEAYDEMEKNVETTRKNAEEVTREAEKEEADIVKGAMDDVAASTTKASSELETAKQELELHKQIAVENPHPTNDALVKEAEEKVKNAENNLQTVSSSGQQKIENVKETAEAKRKATIANSNETAEALVAENLFKETDAKVGTNADGSRDFSATTEVMIDGKKTQKARSLDGLNLHIIPQDRRRIEQEDAKRLNEYAKTIRGRWFNKEANDKAAHEMIMRSEIKK